MRYTLLFMLGVALSMPAEAEASCFRRSCYGCSGCYGYTGCHGGCYGCYGTRCYGGGCYGCYGGYGYTPNYHSAYNHVGASGWYAGYGPVRYYQNTPPYYSMNSTAQSSVNRSSNYFDQAQPTSRKVRLEVFVKDPAAIVTIDGFSTTSTGTTRMFESPELELNKDYYYTVSMKRSPNTQEAIDTRTVSVRAGDQVVIDFTQPGRTLPEVIQSPK